MSSSELPGNVEGEMSSFISAVTSSADSRKGILSPFDIADEGTDKVPDSISTELFFEAGEIISYVSEFGPLALLRPINERVRRWVCVADRS